MRNQKTRTCPAPFKNPNHLLNKSVFPLPSIIVRGGTERSLHSTQSQNKKTTKGSHQQKLELEKVPAEHGSAVHQSGATQTPWRFTNQLHVSGLLDFIIIYYLVITRTKIESVYQRFMNNSILSAY